MSGRTPRHAPPRSRVDPFSDFAASSGNDHGTILSSLAAERAEAQERQHLAKNAGSLLKKMQRGDELDSPQQQQQQPMSQLSRLREAMSSLQGGAAEQHHPQHHHASAARSSPSRQDFSSFLTAGGGGAGDSPGGSSVDRDSSFHHTPKAGGGGAAAGLSSNTAQHILRDMQGLRDSVGRLEQHLMADMKRRVESHAALQRTVELRVREIAENAEKRAQDRTVRLHHTLDSLTQRVAKLEGALAVEREKNARLVQELKYHSVRGLQDVRSQLETERSARSERIASAANELHNEIFRVEEHIAVAKRAREGLSEEVRDAVVRAQEARAESEDKLLQSLMSDVSAMKQRLEVEQREREQGEEQLAGAMADLASEMGRHF